MSAPPAPPERVAELVALVAGNASNDECAAWLATVLDKARSDMLTRVYTVAASPKHLAALRYAILVLRQITKPIRPDGVLAEPFTLEGSVRVAVAKQGLVTLEMLLGPEEMPADADE